MTGNARGRKTMLLCADDFFVVNVTQLYTRVTRAGITAVEFNDGVPRSFRLSYFLNYKYVTTIFAFYFYSDLLYIR